MAKNSNFKLAEPKVIFTGSITTPDGNNYTAITTGISNIDNSVIKNGFFIKNISDPNDYFDIKHNSLNHGSNTGYRLNPGESLFLTCTDIDDIYVKSKENTTISYQLIGA
jgi:hypothetical protein